LNKHNLVIENCTLPITLKTTTLLHKHTEATFNERLCIQMGYLFYVEVLHLILFPARCSFVVPYTFKKPIF